MAKFEVTVERSLVTLINYTIEADNLDEAKEQALDQMRDEEVEGYIADAEITVVGSKKIEG